MEWNRMYSIGRKCLCLAVVLSAFCTVGFAEPKHSTKSHTKRGRACQSLRHLTKNQPHLRKRVQGALEQREAEKGLSRYVSQSFAYSSAYAQSWFSVQRFAEYRDDDPAIKVALKGARRLERRGTRPLQPTDKADSLEVPKTKAPMR